MNEGDKTGNRSNMTPPPIPFHYTEEEKREADKKFRRNVIYWILTFIIGAIAMSIGQAIANG